MTDSTNVSVSDEEGVGRIAEKMEQEAMNLNNFEYLSKRVVALRTTVLQLQAALQEANNRVSELTGPSAKVERRSRRECDECDDQVCQGHPEPGE